MLEHHSDAQVPGSVRRVDVDGIAAPADLAAVRAQHAVDDLHQRALAGAVLAEQRMDAPGHHVHGDLLVGPHAGKALVYLAQGEDRGLGHCCWWIRRRCHADQPAPVCKAVTSCTVPVPRRLRA